MESKKAIRNRMRQERSALESETVYNASKKIIEKIKPYLKGRSKIGIYFPVQNEVNVAWLLDLRKHFFLPKCYGEGNMDFYFFEDYDKLKVGIHDILEPTGNVKIAPDELELMIIPLVAFDENCNRIGQGGGYYDRYLVKTDCLKIGVAYDFQKVDKIKTQAYDVALDIVISERNVYSHSKES